MRCKKFNCLRFLLMEIDLDIHRVGLQVDEPVSRSQFGRRDVAAVEIDDQRGGAIHIAELALAQAEAAQSGYSA